MTVDSADRRNFVLDSPKKLRLDLALIESLGERQPGAEKVLSSRINLESKECGPSAGMAFRLALADFFL
jgi:hypothetical protein